MKIVSENYQNNNIGMDNGGLQPGAKGDNKYNERLNNGAPVRNGSNEDEVSYDNNNTVGHNIYQDRVVNTTGGDAATDGTTYVTARDQSYFALHTTDAENDIDNGTEIGNVTPTGAFHYVAPQNGQTVEKDGGSGKVVLWNDKGTTDDSDDEVTSDRTSEINKIYQVGSVNAMSAR